MVTNNHDIINRLTQLRVSGISSQWRVGGHLVSTEKEDGTDIPLRGWKFDDLNGWQDDHTLTVTTKLPVYPDTLPEKVTLSSRGPAADIHPSAMGVYSKLQGLPPVWENSVNIEYKLFYDGKYIK